MKESIRRKIALIGNPNSGKSSLFNHLTGLNQKIGNFPGVTVDKKTGVCSISNTEKVDIIDLPGTYSIFPRSSDEAVVTDILTDPSNSNYPDVVVVTVDASNIKRNLLLLSQVKDLGIPLIMALNMNDLAQRKGVKYNIDKLAEDLRIDIVPINGRNGDGVNTLKDLLHYKKDYDSSTFFDTHELAKDAINKELAQNKTANPYLALQNVINNPAQYPEVNIETVQAKDTTLRYGKINRLIKDCTIEQKPIGLKLYSDKIDSIATHKIWGYLIFFFILFVIFQAIFAWASWPMDLIDNSFADLSTFVGHQLPPGTFTSLLKDGVIPGIGGVLIFIPQIAILFAFIAILEETGYMARVVFLMDKVMRKFGLNGKSVVPLISGVACAIPAIMAARNIENWKERIITIFVTPLMSCSARLPVYAILIALVIPDDMIFGFLNLQGIVLMGMYFLGFAAALLSALLLKLILKNKEQSFLIMELPTYKMPRWANVGFTIIEKVKTFSFEAGKVIIAISIILWVLASYGPGDNMEKAELIVKNEMVSNNYSDQEFKDAVAYYKLEHSYAGILGKSIEPAISPLGFNWKIGIALITSFAAREVFVGTMATLYSIESASEDEESLKKRMQQEVRKDTGKAFFDLPLGISLMVFYAFAMQCMGTLAIVYRETKGWKWPILQTVYMSALAYVCALIAYQIFS